MQGKGGSIESCPLDESRDIFGKNNEGIVDKSDQLHSNYRLKRERDDERKGEKTRV